MAMSSDITEDQLNIIEQNYIRLETLKNANDQIINEIAKLPIFKYYNLSEYGVISSVDGQKIPTKFKTYKARYSEKYFGGVVGVVAYSFIANHLPLSSIIIGANEHESQYTVDIFLNNTSDIKPIAIASDMHNVNSFNGGLLYIFKCLFMPRFTRIYKTSSKNLVGFRNLTSYKDLLIKPTTKIDKEFIKKNWDSIMRITVSLAKKHSSQHQIIKKLSFYKNNPTLKALASFDSIVMSIYMLNYINDIKTRQIVEKALNRGESFHQLRSAIMKISGKQFQGRTEFELSINNEVNRLLALCILYYSCSLLSALLEVIDPKTDKELYNLVTLMSPVAWKHINMIGKFEFLEKAPNLDIKFIIDNVMDIFRKKLQKKENLKKQKNKIKASINSAKGVKKTINNKKSNA
jgi:TnpA family transposase